MSNELYLGDAVYAEIERGMVKLTTRDGWRPDPTTNTIYLEEPVAVALMLYIQKWFHTKHNVTVIDEAREMEPPVYTRLMTEAEMEYLRGPNDKGLEFDFDEIKKKED